MESKAQAKLILCDKAALTNEGREKPTKVSPNYVKLGIGERTSVILRGAPGGPSL